MVSVEPITTEAIRPTMESGPFAVSKLLTTAKAPLPETGRKSAKGIISAGMPKTRVTGARSAVKKSSAPEARNMVMAATRPTSAGKIPNKVLSPAAAPAKNASKISEEVNIVSTSDCVVYAIETIAPATESYFEEACSILHDTKNECLVILGNTEEFIPYEYWLSIYNNVSNNMQYVPDFILKKLLSYLNQTDALVCTYGFFDDREAGFSIYQRYNPQGHAGNPTQHG